MKIEIYRRAGALACALVLLVYGSWPTSSQVEYVKVCTAYGDGFFYIPGTDNCLKIGGYAKPPYESHKIPRAEIPPPPAGCGNCALLQAEIDKLLGERSAVLASGDMLTFQGLTRVIANLERQKGACEKVCRRTARTKEPPAESKQPPTKSKTSTKSPPPFVPEDRFSKGH